MNHFSLLFITVIGLSLSFSSCKKDDTDINDDGINSETALNPGEHPRLILKFKFDSTQVRLNAFGQPTAVPAGRAAQSPHFNGMSSHYVELATNDFTAIGGGAVLFKNLETMAGGKKAIDFEKSKVVGEGEEFFSIPLSQVPAGSYKWLRISLAYQNYDVKVKFQGNHFTGTLASFIGYNTYIKSYAPNSVNVEVNDDKAQGYWAFEAFGFVSQGQAPAGATTVVNPLFVNSPLPSGSCLVTGQFAGSNMVITGNETDDIIVKVSLSTNDSFEWIDNGDGVYEPEVGDLVIDMGIRGLIPTVQ